MKKPYRIMAVTRSSDTEREIRAAAADLDGGSLDCRDEGLAEVAPTLFNSHAPDVLVVELGLRDADELRQLDGVIRRNAGRMAVVATGRDATVEDVRTMMRLGVADFVPRPVRPEALTTAIELAVERLQPSAPVDAHKGRVVTFMRASGGVGATTLAVETAARFLAANRRNGPSACILDFDLQFGNAALALDLAAATGLGHVLEAGARVDDEFLRGSMVRHASGIEVLAAPAHILPLDAMTPEMAHRIIAFACATYDYTVIDLPPAWTGWTLDVVAKSDLLVVVTQLDVTAIARTRRQLDVLAGAGLDGVPVAVMLNRHRNAWSMRGRRKEAERALGRPIDYVVGCDAATAAAARDRGVLVSDLRRRSPIVKDLSRFVQASSSAAGGGDGKGRRRRLLGGLFGE